jgi:hypothetical protein
MQMRRQIPPSNNMSYVSLADFQSIQAFLEASEERGSKGSL